MGSPHDRQPELGGPTPWWAKLLGVGGFVTLFAVVALFYGLRFGNDLLATQREGIAAINRIEVFEQEQTYQLRLIGERLDRIEAGLASARAGAP